jgi:hypothetical protein
MYSAISEYDSSYCSTYTNHAKERKPYDQFSGWSALRNINEGHVVQRRLSPLRLEVLENTPREFDGVGWPGCGVVDIVPVGRRSAAAHAKKKIGGLVQDQLTT